MTWLFVFFLCNYLTEGERAGCFSKFAFLYLAVVISTGVYLLDFFCSSFQFYVLLIESLSLLYLLFMSWCICSRRWCMDKLAIFMQTKHIYVLIHIWTKGEFGTVKPVYWPFQGGTSFVNHLRYLYVLCLSCFRVCSLLPCGHLQGKGWPLGSRLWCYLCFCLFPM